MKFKTILTLLLTVFCLAATASPLPREVKHDPPDIEQVSINSLQQEIFIYLESPEQILREEGHCVFFRNDIVVSVCRDYDFDPGRLHYLQKPGEENTYQFNYILKKHEYGRNSKRYIRPYSNSVNN